MKPAPLQPRRLSDSIVERIETLVLGGSLRPGERLPSERDLAEELGVSRPSLRDALAELSDRGLLVSRAGSGVFVADVLGSAFSPALIQLFATHDEAVSDYIAFRRDIEGLAAERAARLGSETDLRVIDTIFRKMEAAHQKRDPSDEAQLDAEVEQPCTITLAPVRTLLRETLLRRYLADVPEPEGEEVEIPADDFEALPEVIDLGTVATEALFTDAAAQEAADAKKVAADRRAKSLLQGYTGNSCSECQNFTMVRNGTCEKCDTCGSTSGCS